MDCNENLVSMFLSMIVIMSFLLVLQFNLANANGTLAEQVTAQIQTLDKNQ